MISHASAGVAEIGRDQNLLEMILGVLVQPVVCRPKAEQPRLVATTKSLETFLVVAIAVDRDKLLVALQSEAAANAARAARDDQRL